MDFPMWVDYLTTPQTIVLFLFGAFVGSFLNVCIFRIPEGTFWKGVRSACPHCGKRVPFYLNLPVVGYLILRGRARCCGERLSLQYPLVEFATGVLFAGLYWKFPFIEQMAGVNCWDPRNFIRFAQATGFCCLLLVCSVIDLRHMIIPDVISLPMIAVSPFIVWVHPELDWVSALVGVLAGGLSLYLIAWIYWLIRHEVGMGMGDVKLLAAIGGWLGYQSIIPTIFYGSILGAVSGVTAMAVTRSLNLRSAIPFGPFLAIGAIIHLLLGSKLQEFLFVS